MSSRSKGLKNQRKTKEWFEKKGWTVHNMPIGSRWQSNKDLFGIWDGISILKDGDIVFWQSKTNQKPQLKAYEEWCKKYKRRGLVIVWIDYRKEPREFWFP